MSDTTISLFIGLMAGSIFFIDGWGPTPEGEKDFTKSRRFRGLAVLIAGGVITPVLDFVTTKKPEFFLAYLKGCITGWFFVLLFGLVLYIFWVLTKQRKKESFLFKAGEFAYSILDFIYLGISDNPHLSAKRKNDVALAESIYKLQSDHEYKKLEKELSKIDVKPDELDENTKLKLQQYEQQLKNIKTESDYTFNDWYYKGLAEYDKKEYEKCIAYMKNALDKGDGNNQIKADAHLYMGISYDTLGLHIKGLEQYKTIISEFPNYDLKYLVYYDMGISLDNLNRQEDAVKSYEESIKLNPGYPNSWCNKGVALNKLDLQEEALIAYNEAIRLKPDYVNAIYNRGISLGKLKRFNEAVQAFDEVIKLNPADYEAFCNKGIQLDNLGQHEEALKVYDKAINLKPDYDYTWYHKGLSLADLNRHDEALKVYDEAIKLNPGFADAWNAKGASLYNLGKNDEALTNYEEAIKLDRYFATAWNNKGAALLKLKQLDEAFRAFEEAKRIDPLYADAWFNLAAYYALQKSKTDMLNNLKKAVELDISSKPDAKTDEDFKEYWNDPDFIKLVQ